MKRAGHISPPLKLPFESPSAHRQTEISLSRMLISTFPPSRSFRAELPDEVEGRSSVNPPEQVKLGSAHAPCRASLSVSAVVLFLSEVINKIFLPLHTFSSDGQTVVACSNVAMATHPYPWQQ